MTAVYEHVTLMCRLKAVQARNKELESGERYVRLKELHQKECRAYGDKIRKLQGNWLMPAKRLSVSAIIGSRYLRTCSRKADRNRKKRGRNFG